MSGTRFYFADAAPISYLGGTTGEAYPEELIKTVVSLIKTVNISLKFMVESFIQARGAAYRPFEEEVA